MLIVFSGLPGAGKTTLAIELARHSGAVYLRIDSIEQAIAASRLKIHAAEDAGYLAGYALAEDNLRLGATVIADSVNPLPETRAAWRDVAARAGVEVIELEVVCSDRLEHQRRTETRNADIPGHILPSWQDVLERDYRPWNRGRIAIDTAGKSIRQCLNELLKRLPRL